MTPREREERRQSPGSSQGSHILPSFRPQQVWLNGGFCADLSFTPCHDMAVNLEQAYYIPHLSASIDVLRTNLPTSTAMRAPGAIQASFFIESVLDHIATEMGKAPEDVRAVNFFHGPAGAETMLSTGCLHMPSGPVSHFTLPKIWDQLSASAGLVSRRKEASAFNATNRWRKRGVAMTPVKFFAPLTPMTATVNVYPDGSLLIHHGGCEIGQAGRSPLLIRAPRGKGGTK